MTAWCSFQTQWQFEQAKKAGKTSTTNFYRGAEFITNLDQNTFHKLVGKKDFYLIEFYAPWCSHCQDMVKEFRKAAALLEDVAKVGAVNCEATGNLCKQYNIQSYPTLVLYRPGNNQQGQVYQGGHTPEALQSFVTNFILGEKLVVNLTPENFDKNVGKRGVWLIQFYTPWCGPCMALKPELFQAAASLERVVNVGLFDCQAHTKFCEQHGINYYPILKIFARGKTTGEEITQMNMHAGPALQTFIKTAKLFAPRQRETGLRDPDDDKVEL